MATSSDLNLSFGNFVAMKVNEQSAILRAVENANIRNGMTTPVFGVGNSVAAFVEELAAKPVSSDIRRGELIPKTVAEIYQTSEQAWNAAQDIETRNAVGKFIRGFARAVDTAVITGNGAPATGFGTFADSPSQEVASIADLDAALEDASAEGDVSSIVLSKGLRGRITSDQRNSRSQPLVRDGDNWNYDGVPVFISPMAGIHGAVITEDSVVVGATGTNFKISTEGSANGLSALEHNLVFIRNEGQVASVVLNQNGIVTLTEGTVEEDPED